MTGRSLVAFLFFPLFLLAYTSPGRPLGFVNDFAQILKPETVASLNLSLSDFSKQTGAEITVVTVPNLGGDTIENYAVKLFEDWGIGKAKEDNGLLLLISRDDREMRIEVGYGLEGEVTDIESSHIISEILVPNFRNGNYDAGITQAVNRVMVDIQNGYPLNNQVDSGYGISFSRWAQAFIIIVMFFASVLGRSKSWWAGGVVGGVIALFVTVFTSLLVGIAAALVLVPLGLLFDYFVSKNFHRGGPRPPWFMGGGGGRGLGGGGGFGGFGGGMSGGGGSSGRW